MRTIETTLEVPAREASHVVVKDYGCDECNFISRDKREVEEHYGKTHAVRDRIDYGDFSAMRFETEEAARAWMHVQPGDRDRMDWKGPGWYCAKEYSEPCGHGCCTKWVYELVAADDYLYDLREAGREKLRGYFHIREQIRRRVPCDPATSSTS